jgi:hypothetical protein
MTIGDMSTISGWVTFVICAIGLLIIAAGGILLITFFGLGGDAPEDDDEA